MQKIHFKFLHSSRKSRQHHRHPDLPVPVVSSSSSTSPALPFTLPSYINGVQLFKTLPSLPMDVYIEIISVLHAEAFAYPKGDAQRVSALYTLKSCSLVSREWNAFVKPYLFTRILIPWTTSESDFLLFHDFIGSSPVIASYIRRLYLHKQLKLNTIRTLLAALPLDLKDVILYSESALSDQVMAEHIPPPKLRLDCLTLYSVICTKTTGMENLLGILSMFAHIGTLQLGVRDHVVIPWLLIPDVVSFEPGDRTYTLDGLSISAVAVEGPRIHEHISCLAALMPLHKIKSLTVQPRGPLNMRGFGQAVGKFTWNLKALQVDLRHALWSTEMFPTFSSAVGIFCQHACQYTSLHRLQVHSLLSPNCLDLLLPLLSISPPSLQHITIDAPDLHDSTWLSLSSVCHKLDVRSVTMFTSSWRKFPREAVVIQAKQHAEQFGLSQILYFDREPSCAECGCATGARVPSLPCMDSPPYV